MKGLKWWKGDFILRIIGWWMQDWKWKIVYSSKWIDGVLLQPLDRTSWICWFCYCPIEKALHQNLLERASRCCEQGKQLLGAYRRFKWYGGTGGEVWMEKEDLLVNPTFFSRISWGLPNTFTKCNKISGKASIREMIDYVITSMDWRIGFNQARVTHLCNIQSWNTSEFFSCWSSLTALTGID